MAVDERGGIVDMCDWGLRGEGEDAGEGGGEGEGESELDYEDVKAWVQRRWGWGVGGETSEWEWVRGGKGWWFPGFVGK